MVETLNIINFWSLAFKWPSLFLPSVFSFLGVFPMIFFSTHQDRIKPQSAQFIKQLLYPGNNIEDINTWLSSLSSLRENNLSSLFQFEIPLCLQMKIFPQLWRHQTPETKGNEEEAMIPVCISCSASRIFRSLR